MILSEAFRNIKKSKVFSSIIIIQLIITSIVCNLVLSNIKTMRKDLSEFNRDADKNNYYWIVENLFDQKLESTFWASEDSMQRIKGYYTEMAESEYYEYLELCKQNISLKDESGDVYIRVNNYSVNLKTLCEFDIDAAEGRLFNEDEMDYDFSTNRIPILLGNNLKDNYKIGDLIEGEYFLKPVQYYVIGILKPNSIVIKTNVQEQDDGDFYYEYLDYSYVTPLVNYLEAPWDKEERFFQRILYQMKLNATIAMPSDFTAGELKGKMDTLAAKYDMYSFNVIWVSDQKLNLLKLVSSESMNLMVTIAVLLLVFSVMGLWANINVKMNRSRGDYGIHILTGATKRKIGLYIVTENLIILFVVHIVAFLITKALFSTRVLYSLPWVLMSTLVYFAVCLHPVSGFLRSNLDTLLKGDPNE